MSNNNKKPLTVFTNTMTPIATLVGKCSALLFFTFFLASCSSVGVKSEKAANVNADLGIRYLQGGRLQLANEKLLKALKQSPNSPSANHYYAILQQRLGNTAKAGQFFRKAVNLKPKDPEIRNNYGSFLCDNGQPQAAIQQFTSAINDPLYATPEFAYTNAGICLRKTGNHTKAEEYFRNALKKKSSFPSALLEMAGLYSDRKSYPRAQAFMSRYESVGQSSPKALELCTIINQQMSDIAKSESCKSALLRLFPDSPEAQRAN
ncbi:MAG: type IV pilus biogenesis/stability protein PilW [Cocleimonas sp.]